jgi:hypothetical protein
VHRRLIALSLFVGVVVPAAAAPAAVSNRATSEMGGIAIRIVDVPTDSRNDPLAFSYIVNQLVPGTTVLRQIEVGNSTRSTKAVAVYSAAASLRKGQFTFAPSHKKNELSGWTSVSQSVLRLQPGTKAFETVKIRVPKDASSGERYGVIWAEVSTAGAGRVRLANRVGIRMYVSVGPGGAPPSNFAIRSLVARRSASGQPLVIAKIHNSGRRTIAISGNLTLSKGPGGVRAGPFPVKLVVPLPPGVTRSVTVRLDRRLPRGPWRAELRLRGRLLQRVGVTTITFPRGR